MYQLNAWLEEAGNTLFDVVTTTSAIGEFQENVWCREVGLDHQGIQQCLWPLENKQSK